MEDKKKIAMQVRCIYCGKVPPVMDEKEYADELRKLKEQQNTREENPAFFKLWNLKCVQKWKEDQKHLKGWDDYEIYANTTKDITMSVWNGEHEPSVEANYKEHTCKAGTRVRVWMVSRLGDVGVTDNLTNPKGYDVRGLDADIDLTDYEFIELNRA